MFFWWVCFGVCGGDFGLVGLRSFVCVVRLPRGWWCLVCVSGVVCLGSCGRGFCLCRLCLWLWLVRVLVVYLLFCLVVSFVLALLCFVVFCWGIVWRVFCFLAFVCGGLLWGVCWGGSVGFWLGFVGGVWRFVGGVCFAPGCVVAGV